MDMRLLGLSLQGADRIISDGIIILTEQRLPKRGERAPLVLKVNEPIAGSYDLFGTAQDTYTALALGLPIVNDIGADFLWNWTKAILAHFTGKNDIAEVALNKMVDVNRDHLAARDASEAHAHEERMAVHENSREVTMALIDVLRQGMLPLGAAAEKLVAPVGKSVDLLDCKYGANKPVRIEKDEADKIREYGDLEWEALETVKLRTDGFRFHNSGLSVENPEREGFLMAKVHDPIFLNDENPYTEAARKRADIMVLARKGYKAGVLVQIDVVDFKGEV
jgi:hypothetical protein